MSWFTSLLKSFKRSFKKIFGSAKEKPISPDVSVPDVDVKKPIDDLFEIVDVKENPTDLNTFPDPDPGPIREPDIVPTPISEEECIVSKFSKMYGLNPRMVRAVAIAESSKNAFREYKGLGIFPTLRFEPHWFNKYEKKSPMPFTNNGKGFSSLVSETNHVAFIKASKININAAIKGTSFGKFQIMGFHFKKLGFKNPEEFLESMKSLEGQYDAFIRFIMSNKRLRNVITKDIPTRTDFEVFARAYNGSGNVNVYSKRIERAYNSLA
jgi:hypothetical protein